MRHVAYKTWAQGRLARKTSPSTAPPAALPRKSSPNTAPPAAFPRRSSPSAPSNTHFEPFFVCWASFFALTPTSGRAGRRMSRTGRGNMATLKLPTPLLAPNKGPMKPASPLRPKTAPKKPISHSQRRWRFQLAHLTGPQRRRRFQTTRPPGRQGQAAAPAGGGWASPRRPWAISVTNVVKPTRFQSPREDLCYKRRQSASKNLDFQRKSR